MPAIGEVIRNAFGRRSSPGSQLTIGEVVTVIDRREAKALDVDETEERAKRHPSLLLPRGTVAEIHIDYTESPGFGVGTHLPETVLDKDTTVKFFADYGTESHFDLDSPQRAELIFRRDAKLTELGGAADNVSSGFLAHEAAPLVHQVAEIERKLAQDFMSNKRRLLRRVDRDGRDIPLESLNSVTLVVKSENLPRK